MICQRPPIFTSGAHLMLEPQVPSHINRYPLIHRSGFESAKRSETRAPEFTVPKSTRSYVKLPAVIVGFTCSMLRAQRNRKRTTQRGHQPDSQRQSIALHSVSPVLAEGDTVAVVGAGGNVGRLVTQRLCDLGKYKVHGVLRSPDSARSRWANGVEHLELFQADVRDCAALEKALATANSVVCATGVPAFGFSGQWKDGNHPESVDHYGVKNALHAWMSGSSTVPKKRFALMSSIGVRRRTGLPYSILNGGGVLDAKARGEEALLDAAQEQGFACAIVRPGQLFGGPYDNNRYLGTLFQLDKEVDARAIRLEPGDTAVGDTLRSSLAGVLVRCLFAEASCLEFSATNEVGEAPTDSSVDAMIYKVGLEGASASTTDEQYQKRISLGAETFGKAVSNVVSGKLVDDNK